MIKLTMIALFGLATMAFGQGYGTISRPDIMGDQHFRYSNGINGTISRPDIMGDRHIQYNTPTYSVPTYQQFNQYPQTMPRRSTFNQYY